MSQQGAQPAAVVGRTTCVLTLIVFAHRPSCSPLSALIHTAGPSEHRKLSCFVCHKPNPGFDSTRSTDHIAPSVPVCGKACEAKYLHSKELRPVVGGKVAQRSPMCKCWLVFARRPEPAISCTWTQPYDFPLSLHLD